MTVTDTRYQLLEEKSCLWWHKFAKKTNNHQAKYRLYKHTLQLVLEENHSRCQQNYKLQLDYLIFTKSTRTAYPCEKFTTCCIFHDNCEMCWSQQDLRAKIRHYSVLCFSTTQEKALSVSFYLVLRFTI